MSLKSAVKDARKQKVIRQELDSSQWTGAKIRQLLASSNVFVERALCVLLARQTDAEVQAGTVNINNNMGFCAPDAKFLTSLAKQVIANRFRYPPGKKLSYQQFKWARKKLDKYAGQLAMYANKKDIVKAEQALNVFNDNDFQKGGTYRKVDYGGEETKENKDIN